MNKPYSDSKGPELPERSGTEQKILDAARAEFVAKGLAGARMQSVADSAGVNKALLYYYFRSKMNLYEAVLQDTMARLWSCLREAVQAYPQTGDIRELIHTIVSLYIRTMQANPDFPHLFLREVADGSRFLPEVVKGIATYFADVPRAILLALERESAQGHVRRIDPLHFIVNVMGMCAASFIVKPMVTQLQGLIPDMAPFDENDYFGTRIRAITEMACDGICIGRKSK
ncbi:MAG: TetR family transcriptional regulator [Chitinivibrionales bacterium]|nr:TetR family transcriptional regulator [Chitinivibrionales bacterium]